MHHTLLYIFFIQMGIPAQILHTVPIQRFKGITQVIHMLLQAIFMLRTNQIIEPESNGKTNGNHTDTLCNRHCKVIQRCLPDNNNRNQKQLHTFTHIEPHTNHNGNNGTNPDGQIGSPEIIGHNNGQYAPENGGNNFIFYGIHRAFQRRLHGHNGGNGCQSCILKLQQITHHQRQKNGKPCFYGTHPKPPGSMLQGNPLFLLILSANFVC